MQNYIFVATSLILVYVIYLIRHIVSKFFLCLKRGLCVNYYINAKFIVFTIKKVVVTSLHQVEYKFTL